MERAQGRIMRARKKSWDQRRRERRMKMREAIASETPQQRELRLENLRRYMKRVRASETPEQRETRLADNRDKMRRVRARRRRQKKTAQQPQRKASTQRARAPGTAGGDRAHVQRTWETLEEAARRIMGDRWKYLETLMAERKSGISVAEASDMFQDEIRQGLIHVCCLCNRLLFQKSEVQPPGVKLEDSEAQGLAPDPTCGSDISLCPHQDTVQLCLI